MRHSVIVCNFLFRYPNISTSIFKFMIICVILLSFSTLRASADYDSEILMIVKGVAVPFSVFGLIKRLEEIPGVENVQFDLNQGLAHIKIHPGVQVTNDQLRQAVVDASYTPGNIKRLSLQRSTAEKSAD